MKQIDYIPEGIEIFLEGDLVITKYDNTVLEPVLSETGQILGLRRVI
jgi:hypothetical protein